MRQAELGEAALELAGGLGDPLLVLDQREPHVPVALGAEADTGRDRDVAVADDQLGEVDRPELEVGLGDRRPGEHRAAGARDRPARAVQPVAQGVAAGLVDLVDLERVVGGVVQGDRRGDLDRLERAVVQVALELAERPDDLAVADQERDPPPGHRERLRHRVQLDRDLLGALALQDRGRHPPVERGLGVREVVHQHHVALARPVDQALQVGELDGGPGRVVRERQDDDPGLGPAVLPRLHDVLDEVLAGPDAHLARVGPREVRTPDVDRVGRRRHDRRVAGLQQHPHQVAEALLGADRADDLGLGVERDAEPALVESGDRGPQLGDAARGRVAVVAGVVRRLGELLDRDARRGDVGVAEPEVDHVASGPAGLDLEPVDDREDVRRQAGDATELHHRRVALAPGRPLALPRSDGPGRSDQSPTSLNS